VLSNSASFGACSKRTRRVELVKLLARFNQEFR